MKKYNMHVFFSKFNLIVGLGIILVFVMFAFTSDYELQIREGLLGILGGIFIIEEITRKINMQYTYLFVRVIQLFKQCILSLLFFLYKDISVIACMSFLLYFYISLEFLIVFKSKNIEKKISIYGQMIIPIVIVFIIEIFNREFSWQETVVFIMTLIAYLSMLIIMERYFILNEDFILKVNSNPFEADRNKKNIFQDDLKISSRVISRMLGIDDINSRNIAGYDVAIKKNDFERFIGSVDISDDIEFVTKSLLNSIEDVDYVLIILQSEKQKMIIGNESVIGKDIINRTKIAIRNGEFFDLIKNCDHIVVDNDIDLDKYPYLKKEDNINSIVISPLKKDNENIGILITASHVKNFFSKNLSEIYSVIAEQLVHQIEKTFLCRMFGQLAIKDGLTGSYNRRYLIELFNEISNEINKNKGNKTKTSVALFDLDKFKTINDTYGHLFGDTVIKVCSRIAKEVSSRNNGIVARYGGEEFVIVFPGKSIEETEKILKEIMEQIESFKFIANEKIVNVDISVGISSYPDLSKDFEALLKHADKAMYYSKKNGRGRITIYNKKIDKFLEDIDE